MAPSPKPDNDLTANGPALFYISTQDENGTQSVQRIDIASPVTPRERAISRALLHHALRLLDASEPTQELAIRVDNAEIGSAVQVDTARHMDYIRRAQGGAV